MKQADIDVTYIGHYGDDLSVVNAARVSFHKESEWDVFSTEGFPALDGDPFDWKLKQSDAKLINYLAKHKHFSPFNHAFLSFRVKAPIFVARQLVKHKFMPWNEVSRRYVDEEPEFYIPRDWRAKADNVKQGSSEEFVEGLMYIGNDGTGDLHGNINDAAFASTEYCLDIYQGMLAKDVAPEMARMVLPQNMMTEWIWSGTLGAYCDMLRLRLDPHTQYESRIVAQKIYEQVEPLFPVSVKALLEM